MVDRLARCGVLQVDLLGDADGGRAVLARVRGVGLIPTHPSNPNHIKINRLYIIYTSTMHQRGF